MAAGEGVAVVGWAGRFPGAGADARKFWELVRDGRDASSEPPPNRWHLPPNKCTRPGGPHPDSVPHARGYFLEPFDPPKVPGLPAEWVARLDPLYHLALDLGLRAWLNAKTDGADKKRAGVILGNICLPTESSNALARDLLGAPISAALVQKHPAGTTHPWNRYVAGLPAGLIARALGLGHLAFTLDAACASSLYAVKLACDELIEGRADVMLAGGLNRADSQYTQMGFAQLRALSAGGRCAPFDRNADGLMVGEGGAVFVLKRLADAERDGDRVLALLRGWGLSNDVGANLLAPAVEGQLRAMRAAYDRAGWRPEDVDLIECHATGTPTGDGVEFRSLSELWGDARRPGGACLIGSVKASVGHLLTGAGAAALAKILLSLEHETRPAQANFRKPHPDLPYAEGPFRVPEAPVPWERRSPETPRRAAVSGFGFGGVNAHLLVEEYMGFDPVGPSSVPKPAPADPIAVVGAGVRVGPWDGTREFLERSLGGGDPAEPAPKANGWKDAETPCPPGFYRDEVALPRGAFRTPPKELAAMLPQQLLAMQACADALAMSGQADRAGPDPRTGVFLGLGLDLNTTNYHLRWEAIVAGAPQVADDLSPPLDADRTMGHLGSVAASRVARAFEFGGPSFTSCSEESSSGRALELAVRALRRGELDRAVVGGVDLAGDPRAVLPTREAWPAGAGTPGEGAAAVVLRRLSDAQRLGEPVLAVVAGVGSAVAGNGTKLGPTPEASAEALRIALADAGVKEKRLAFVDDALSADGTAGRVGNAGMASGAVALARACFALKHHILPPSAGRSEPAFWLHDTAVGPRRAAVRTAGADGTVSAVILQEYVGAGTPPDAQPLGARPEALFVLEGGDAAELAGECDRLSEWLAARPAHGVERLARDWLAANRPRPGCARALALVARSGAELAEQLAWARPRLAEWGGCEGPGVPPAARDRVFHSAAPIGPAGKVAFVFPGSGNHFAGMGRDLGAHFPAVLRRQQAESSRLRSQFAPALFWADAVPDFTTAKQYLFGQVTHGALVADLLQLLGVRPAAMLGLSLGESAGLFGVRVWSARDEMYKRIEASKLFGPELGRPYDAARRAWQWPTGKPLPWLTAVLAAPPGRVREMMRDEEKAYLLIVNTPTECVVGGHQDDVEALASRVGGAFVRLEGVTLAHCEAGRPVEKPYRELHTLPASPVWGLTLYSGQRAEPYPAESGAAADSITAGLVGMIDFPKLIRRAHADGVRVFLEVGPGQSCTRMIGAILGDTPHLARPATAPRQSGVSLTLRLLAALAAERYPVDLAALYGQPSACAGHRDPAAPPADAVRVPVGRGAAKPPAPNAGPPLSETERGAGGGEVAPRPRAPRPHPPRPLSETERGGQMSPALADFVAAVARTQATAAAAHELFLNVQAGFTQAAAAALQLHAALLGHGEPPPADADGLPDTVYVRSGGVPRSLTKEQCFEFARGKIGDVLGPLFAPVDAHPTRVRLPDGPLMLVDRVLTIEGEPRSLQSGRVVTEHDVTADRWYLDAGRIPTCVAVESGQADLFLSGFLGIDFETRGLAVYRLIDAVVTFHAPLPRVGDTIRYDISIDEFIRQGDAWLFRFRFESFVGGQPLLTMTNGVAGFFTAEALAGGQGIVKSRLDQRRMEGKKPADWRDLVPLEDTSLDAGQVAALRRGDLVGAFGPAFSAARLRNPMRLPGGMLRLLDRVTALEPAGGRYGVGFVRAEYDVAPDDWFLTCHFVDDMVMPGTLMYECCLHTLRVLLMRLGWVGEDDSVACEPVPGRSSRLKCRGQVIASTKMVAYEVTVKELGYGPEPYCVADALMYADGKPIVEIGDMTLRMSGLTRAKLEAVWGLAGDGLGGRNPDSTRRTTVQPTPGLRYGKASILAYSNGNPSEAFGEPYKPFDRDRVLARLPGPPFQFMDRVVSVTGEPFVMQADAACVAEYDVPPVEWYFDANRCARMPFSVLLEVALQPCGWLAAYCGSALTSDEDLRFRNLGGKATLHRPVGPNAGTLTMSAKLTSVSKSAGMVIQHYAIAVRDRSGVVYDGTTYFGFFTKDALANQVGMPQAKVPYLSPAQLDAAEKGELPREAPFPAPMLRMVDRIDGYLPTGGAAGLGLVQGSVDVDPEFWFFQAHFYQDPVWPGSLGLESFLQLLKFAAWRRWGAAPASGWQATAPGAPHSWTYRGQVLPTDKTVTVVVEVTAVDDARRRLTAGGYLTVDGRVIYQMAEFTVE